MLLNNFFTKRVLPFCLISILFACDVVKLDEDNNPIIPMSEEEMASLTNMEPAEIANKLWADVYNEASEESVDISSYKPEDNKSLFIKFSGIIEDVDDEAMVAITKVRTDNHTIDLQMGPIIKGNSIRDAISFIKFDQFKNQVQFAKLTKELNKKAIEGIERPDQSWKNIEISGVAAVTVKDQNYVQAVPIILNKGK